MEQQRQKGQGLLERKGLKRKLEQVTEEETPEISAAAVPSCHPRLLCEVRSQVDILNSTFSWVEADRAAAKRAANILAELAKNGNGSLILPTFSYFLDFSVVRSRSVAVFWNL
uniref:Uncharacterized protein n=1 Tax=Rhizophora mucronata TaxID=61149 RepID=A0A2P2LPC7_RHIMU